MALFILSIIGFLVTAALIWCLMGFSRALKEKPKVIGLLVRPGIKDAHKRQRKAMVIAFPGHSPPPQAGATRFRKYRSLSMLIVVWNVILLASPAANRNLSAMAPPTSNRNSETPKTVFVELSEMRLRGA